MARLLSLAVVQTPGEPGAAHFDAVGGRIVDSDGCYYRHHPQRAALAQERSRQHD